MGSKPRILICTDTACIDSGMGVAHKEIATRLYATQKYEIASFGWFFHSAQQRGVGWTYPWKQFTTSAYDRPYGHPDGWPNASSQQWKDSTGYQIIEKFKPTVVIALGDMWMCDWIYTTPNRKSFKLMHELPVDGEPVPREWTRLFKTAETPIVMSQYGRDVITQVDKYMKVEYLPRGIDLTTFRPINATKDELRKRLMPGSEGKFVVGVFDRYQDRKQIHRAVESFAKFVQDGKHQDCDIYLHLDMNDPFSKNSQKSLSGENGIIERYGIENHAVINQKVTVEKGVPIKELVALYNCCDVKLATPQGEGFGLTNLEAMACGVPVIGTNYTTFPELLGNRERGLLIDVQTYITGMYNVERALVDTEHASQLIEMMYRSPSLRKQMSQNCVTFSRQFNWEGIMKRWEKLIDSLIDHPRYRLLKKPRPFYLDVKEVNLEGALKENTGWAITTRGFAQGLMNTGWNVNITESGGSNPDYPLHPQIFKALHREKSKVMDLINHMPSHAFEIAKKSSASFKAVYFPFELDHMLSEYAYHLNRDADIYLCPTTYVEGIAKRAGVRNTAVVPLASNINTKIKADIDDLRGYSFLVLGNLGDYRKNVHTVVKAFMRTFTDEDNVTLVLKGMPGHENSDPTELIKFESLGMQSPPNIKVVHLDDGDVAKYYSACDCLIHAAYAEGWGHPVFEALKFGMPIIATDFGGYLDFVNKGKNVSLIKGDMVSANASPLFFAKERWCQINFEDLGGAMKKAYSIKMRKTGEDYVKDYTWESTAKALEEAFKKIDKRPKKRIYYERMQKNLWNEDNERGFKTYAPNRIEFIGNPEDADLQILDITRISDKDYLRCDKYILFMHCFGEWSEENPMVYKSLFENALAVYSHLDLASVFPELKHKFIRGPWGVDPDKWMKSPNSPYKPYIILNTGEIAETEGIKECIVAAENANKKLIHVGTHLPYTNKSYSNVSNLSTRDMRDTYNASLYVSALRRFEGFEKPAMEGLLCGARPICFDTPLYRFWYGDLAEYVPESTEAITSSAIQKIFEGERREVTLEEQNLAIEKFGWKNVSINFWNELERWGIF